ncbi:unnamed protein product [Ranitomeya imitator]|uniref:ribonuclease H n=1 Tax=Ranitomeya imitator TaxID=111125 RepID=A0ABN9MJ59_9NEOB|nr:unnamed protein product [Ranitomeya imitator]
MTEYDDKEHIKARARNRRLAADAVIVSRRRVRSSAAWRELRPPQEHGHVRLVSHLRSPAVRRAADFLREAPPSAAPPRMRPAYLYLTLEEELRHRRPWDGQGERAPGAPGLGDSGCAFRLAGLCLPCGLVPWTVDVEAFSKGGVMNTIPLKTLPVVNSVVKLPPVVMNGTSAGSVHGLPLVVLAILISVLLAGSSGTQRERLRTGDEWKTAFNTPKGHFEYLVMPFGLSNAPSVFQSFMHDIFREYLDKFLIVYLDDILVFSDDWESHVKQIEVDASEIGAGAVLSQRSSDGSVMKPCAFFSRKISPAERNYDVGNRELLAMNPEEALDAYFYGFYFGSPCLSKDVGHLGGQVESSDCPGVDTVVDRLQQIWTHVVDNLTLSQEKAQRFANRRRCVGPRLRVGDLVWLSSRYVPMKVSSPKFKPRFFGTYKISEVFNPVSFRLTLPASFAIHNVFHRLLLRRYVAPVVPSIDPPAPVLVEGELEYVVEKILDSRISRRKLQYLVKWKGYGQEDNSWVFASDVHAADLVRAFHLARPGRPGGSVIICGGLPFPLGNFSEASICCGLDAVYSRSVQMLQHSGGDFIKSNLHYAHKDMRHVFLDCSMSIHLAETLSRCKINNTVYVYDAVILHVFNEHRGNH